MGRQRVRNRHSAGWSQALSLTYLAAREEDWELNSLLRNSPLPPGAQEEQKWPPGREAAGSALQLVCDGEDSLQDRHEAGYLAEAAAACHLRMHCQALFKVACIHTTGNFMEPSQDVR